MRRRGFRDLPLLWKMLVPYVVLVVIVGAADTFIALRQLNAETRAAVDRELTSRSADLRERLHDRELYVEEAANYAANLQGVAGALRSHDVAAATRLLRSVLVLKPDLALVAVSDVRGIQLSELSRASPAVPVTDWSLVREALASADGGSRGGFVRAGGRSLLVVAEAVCAGAQSCDPAGVALAALDTGALAAEIAGPLPAGQRVLLRDASGRTVADAGSSSPPVAAAEVPFAIQGSPAGSLTVELPTAQASASVRDAGVRLVLVLLAAILGLTLAGSLLARWLLMQLKALIEASRALGAGELSARAPVIAADEHGELARVFNQMASQLQASHQRLESQVEQRTAEINRLLRERTEFFAGLSHELRTPLAVILAQAEMLQHSSHDARNGRSSAAVGGMVGESARQVLDTVNRILELARADASRIEVQLQPVAVAEVFERLRPTVDGLAKAAGVGAKVLDPPADLEVVADRDRLTEVMLNLVENAVKYTPAGEAVEVRAEVLRDSVQVAVADRGIGIPLEVGDRVFDPFYRVPGANTQRGEPSSGLGLALARKLIEAQHGLIRHEPRPGGGTTFLVVLPAAAPLAR